MKITHERESAFPLFSFFFLSPFPFVTDEIFFTMSSAFFLASQVLVICAQSFSLSLSLSFSLAFSLFLSRFLSLSRVRARKREINRRFAFKWRRIFTPRRRRSQLLSNSNNNQPDVTNFKKDLQWKVAEKRKEKKERKLLRMYEND